MRTIAESWEQLEVWLKKNWKDGYKDLNKPATDQEIAKLEKTLQIKLPEDFIALLKVHNGQKCNVGGFFDGSEFLSTESIIDQWTCWKELLDNNEFEGVFSNPQNGVKNDWWNAKWIPITHNGGGDHICIDLDPVNPKDSGQLISMWHDSGERYIHQTDFKTWFNQYVDDVLSGNYVYSEDDDAIINKDDL